MLEVAPEQIDLHLFRRMERDARAAADDERAAALLRESLGLWTDNALSGLTGAWVEATRARLDEERIAASLRYHDIEIRLGRSEALLADLREWVAAHPLDERLVGQLMEVLYRCGRQGEALECFDSTRKRLAEQLGIDPGPELHGLHQRMLVADPALSDSASVPQAMSALPVPQQLPLPPSPFTGRSRELDELDHILASRADADRMVVISTLGGTGGIGKTWLALHWAHRHLEEFPDGQLYVNLRGFDPAVEPLSPTTALRGFLETLGTAPQAIPSDPDSQAGLYRSLVAGKRLLILLDDARDAAQIVPLLPGSPSCAVLITSRNQLTGLATVYGARPLALDVLSDAEARELLHHRLGAERVAAEPESVSALVRRCAGLPLALGILAARAATHPDFSLAVLADELSEDAAQLDVFDTGDVSGDLRGVFAASYRALAPETAQVFALLGLAPGPDISLRAAAALIGQPVPRTRALLRSIEAAHLVRQGPPDRYHMHDLVRLYAMERGELDFSPKRWTPLCAA
ncbi:AfsR/SARP family transcriptional regulator [Streptomyces rhizosphaericus]|uniref:AfsR/SARP family transcriptional regulator n=1 Tax=Streptomyces rhizosphaericus TaxID=114699 RepID=UPI0036257B34